MRPKVSIIIPVYRSEQYIGKCIRSLFEQTLRDLEFIFIDDCGNDESFNIIENVLKTYPSRHSQVKFIHHERNLGVSQSRQDGVDAATGEYIIHCDSDDWIESQMYEKLYSKAKENDLDIVVCGYKEIYPSKVLYIEQNLPLTKYELIENLIDGVLHGSLCNKLINRELYKSCKFTTGITLWEDLLMCIHIFANTNKITSIKDCLYNYRRINNSITSSLNCEKIDSMIKMGYQMIEVLSKLNHNDKYSNIIRQIAFNSRKNLLLTGNGCYNPNKWRYEFKEYNKYWYKVKATPLLRLFYLMTLLHLDFVTKIYVSRPPFLLKIKRFIKRK